MILYQQAVIIMIVVMIVPSILFVFYAIVAVNLIRRLVFILLFNCFFTLEYEKLNKSNKRKRGMGRRVRRRKSSTSPIKRKRSSSTSDNKYIYILLF